MKSLIYDKEYLELTAKELQREWHLQRWLLWMMKRYIQYTDYKRGRQLEAMKPEEGLTEDYINGFITAEQYRKGRRKQGVHMRYVQIWSDRNDFCDRMAKLLQGEISEIEDILASGDEVKIRKKMGRPRTKPRVVQRGYDPRKNASINNVRPKERETSDDTDWREMKICGIVGVPIEETDFCSHGERRER